MKICLNAWMKPGIMPAKTHTNSASRVGIFALCIGSALLFALPASAQKQRIAIAIHGGAGVIERATLSKEKEELIRADLERAVRAGYARLSAGESSLDAVSAAIVVLEDSPHFNAGKGAVYTHEASHALDAAIMDGSRKRAGAVAGVSRIKNPILLARSVMDNSSHVLLSGTGAENFARNSGIIALAPTTSVCARFTMPLAASR